MRGGRTRQVLDRWSVASIGVVVRGPTVTVLAVLLVGVERGTFVVWAALRTFVFFVGLTIFWAAVLRRRARH